MLSSLRHYVQVSGLLHPCHTQDGTGGLSLSGRKKKNLQFSSPSNKQTLWA
jgi:hypothetical protein